MSDDYILMPKALTAENGAKAALIGEFTIEHEATCSGCYYDEPDEDCEVCGGEIHYIEHVAVPWDTIKDVYAAAVKTCASPKTQGSTP
jgi:rRNA maturation endonuclease Nob1